jgi:hypothetical protein
MMKEKSTPEDAMSQNSAVSTPVPAVPPAAPPKIHITPGGRESLKLYEKEIATYLRELHRLLADGKARHYVVVDKDTIFGVWDNQNDAIEAAREKFGLGPIFVKLVDPRDSERFAILFKQLEGESCP